jgi:phospholipid transport system substrate-binding protein
MTTISTRAVPRRLPPAFALILALSGFALMALSASANAQQAPAAPAASPAAAPAVTRSPLAPVAPSAATPAAAPVAPVAPAAPTRNATSSIERSAAQTANPPAAAKIDTPPARKESPAGYMKRVGNDLLLASRSGSVSQIAMVLSANADVPSIGLNALGDYARSLPKTDRPMYYSGMVNFIARYAAKEAPKYPIARFIVTAQSQDDARGTYVDSHITLASGDAYDVRWLVVKREGVYKVRDAQVIGFWMTSFLDNLFQNYISENGGNPKSLVVALNH